MAQGLSVLEKNRVKKSRAKVRCVRCQVKCMYEYMIFNNLVNTDECPQDSPFGQLVTAKKTVFILSLS